MSLNGKIAQTDGSVHWLEAIPNPLKLDYGYADFYQSVDTTIQGYKTYEQILNWGIPFPYADKKNYVLTRKKKLENTEHVEFISRNPVSFLKNLKAQTGKDIWLIGGGQINTLLFNAHLIDELYVFIMPIVLSSGIELFETLPIEQQLELVETKTYPTGVVELRYKVFEGEQV